MASQPSRPLSRTPDSGVAWKRVDPDIRRQTWVQAFDVTSLADGTFSCSIDCKETSPSYQKPLTGGYSQSKLHVIKLQWQSNGDYSGVFRMYFNYGDSQHDGSYLIDPRTVVKTSWTKVFKSFPSQYLASSARLGVLRVWGFGAPANTFLGNVVATIQASDKFKST